MFYLLRRFFLDAMVLTKSLIIMQSDFVKRRVVQEAIAEVKKKKARPAVSKLRMENFTEGSCAQILHVDPFSEEGPTPCLHPFKI